MIPQAFTTNCHSIGASFQQDFEDSRNFEANPSLVGTAFDYVFRWHVRKAYPKMLVAYHANRTMLLNHMGVDGSGVKEIVTAIVEQGNNEPSFRASASVLLAHFERVFRSGEVSEILKVAFKDTSKGAIDTQVTRLIASLNPNDVSDVANLTSTIDDVWGDRLKERFIPNPTFQHSESVGGADGDWILGNTLYDCKCSWKRKPFTKEMLFQIVAYRLLGTSPDVESLGFYFPRHKSIVVWRTDQLINDLEDKLKSFYTEAIKPTEDRIWSLLTNPKQF